MNHNIYMVNHFMFFWLSFFFHTFDFLLYYPQKPFFSHLEHFVNFKYIVFFIND